MITPDFDSYAAGTHGLPFQILSGLNPESVSDRLPTVKRNLPSSAYVISSVLAVSHVIFYFAVMSEHFKGRWGGFLVFLVDSLRRFLRCCCRMSWGFARSGRCFGSERHGGSASVS